MKVSLFCEHILPRPWRDDSEYDRLQQSLEQFELADKLGYHAIWMTEHHFLEEYCHSTAPEVFLAAVSQRTKNLRLGHGIVQMIPGINHPARVAERIGVLDLVSNGRVEFGTGEGTSATELEGFNIDPGKKRQMWEEAIRTCVRCMADTPFTGIDGEFVKMPPRNVVPKPRQKPHPPLWLACTRHDTLTLAGESGIGALSFSYAGPEKFTERIQQYYGALERAVPIGRAVNANILAAAGQLMCCPNEDEAFARIGNAGSFFGYGVEHYYVNGDHLPGRTNVWEKYQRMLAENPHALDRSRLQAVGTPDTLRKLLRRFEAAGLDQVMFLLPPVAHESIMETIDLVGREVLPEFIERDAAAVLAKEKRLAPVIERAMARKRDNSPPLDPDYRTGAIAMSWDGFTKASEIADQVVQNRANQEALERERAAKSG